MIGALTTFCQGQRGRVQQALEPKIPESRKAISLSDRFWTSEEERLLSILLPLLQEGAEGGVAVHQAIVERMGIGIDWTQPNTEAAKWARKYGGKLITQVTETTRNRVNVAVGNWLDTPGSNLGQLWAQIAKDPAFDARRAKLIAITETTNAYAQGELTAAREIEKAGYFEYEKQWETNNDDIVCEICRPLQYDGTNAVQGVRGLFPNGTQAPPAHPGCRCWVNTVPRVPQ